MWPRRDIIDLLGIEHPIIQAPMAGSTTPALAAAVSNAGGLGSLGCAGLSVEALREEALALRAATNRPFNLNFFVHETPLADPERESRTRALLKPLYDDVGLSVVPDVTDPLPSFDEARLEALLEIRPAVVSFHFGLPAADRVRALKQAGVLILSSAATVAEARELEAGGVDAVIAQGWEAGGHRGTFASPFEAACVGTLALVPQVADAVSLPVIAAGGIADGRGIAAAFALGASAVQMGTAFLACPEASLPAPHREALRRARDEDTRVTRAFSGRPARGLVNRYIEALASHDGDLPAFPRMRSLAAPLAKASIERGSPDFIALWSGQAAALNRELPAAELMARLVEECRARLGFERA